MQSIEICCDASIKTFPNGRTFGCAGAIVVGLNIERFKIVPDCTNNIAELIALYTALQLAKEFRDKGYLDITIYADSKFAVYGTKVWMENWISNMDINGILRNYSGQPVKNQKLFKMILSYIVSNKLTIKLRHQKGHVKLTQDKLAKANKVFYESNGYYLSYNDIYKISLYNNIIDKDTRDKLQYVNTEDYPMNDESSKIDLCKYVIPDNYSEYIY